jgi:hypothetical protein
MKKKILTLVLTFMLAITPVMNIAFAQTKKATKGTNDITSNLGKFSSTAYGQNTLEGSPVIVAGRIINALLGLAGMLLVIYLVYGGFRWMTAAGDTGSVDQAKRSIRNAIIGIIIALGSYAISTFVVESVVQSTVK